MTPLRLPALSAALALALATTLVPAAAQPCATDEAPLYTGRVGKKSIRVCATPAKPPYSRIEYRYGPAGVIELAYTADGRNGNRFFASNQALMPRASLSHLWFVNGDTTYVITECIGGRCPHGGGLVVAKGRQIVARIKVQDGKFSADDAVDFLGEKSFSPLIGIQYPEGLDLPALFD
ncbi:MAG: hypothetical protein RL522_779 [Pseudomonadota bacterium]|jgi:hypothetical protein